MVTHDVDEALFLSDRVAMMTSGPAATLGAVLTIPFPRPRIRKEVLEHPDYYPLREKLIGFLESQSEPRARVEPAVAPRRESTPGNREGSEPPVLPFSRSAVSTNGP
jgi:nitrate/nitrite transport system ATP-binding protein